MKTLKGLVLALLSVCLLLSFSSTFCVHAVVGRVYIRSDGSIDPPVPELLSNDNVTYFLTGNLSSSIVIERDNIMFDGAGHTLSGEGSNVGIELQWRNNVTITDVEIRDFYSGIQIHNFSRNNNVFGVRAIDNWYSGIEVRDSSTNNNLTGNTIVRCQEGIVLMENANNNVISRNDIEETTFYGVSLMAITNNVVDGNNVSKSVSIGIRLWGLPCRNNMIVGNNVMQCKVGIEVSFRANNNTIIQNSISMNSRAGLKIGFVIGESGPEQGGATDNSFIENNVTNNNVGIYLIYSKNNTILRNNIQGNNASIIVQGSYINMWDNGYEGNFWSDYNGTDGEGGILDGIGDTPYAIDSNNVDTHPLMHMYYPQDVHVLCDFQHIVLLFGAKANYIQNVDPASTIPPRIWFVHSMKNSVNGLPFDEEYNLVWARWSWNWSHIEVIDMRDVAQAIINYNQIFYCYRASLLYLDTILEISRTTLSAPPRQ